MRGARICDTPVGTRSAGAGGAGIRVWVETELITADVEADVERLVEIGLDAEHRAVPGLGPFDVGDVVDHRAQAEDRRLGAAHSDDTTKVFPSESMSIANLPHGCCSGSPLNSTPRALSSA